MLKSVIIDDEPNSLKTISAQLQLYCPNVEVVATYDKPFEGLKAIQSNPPDLLFLDIIMPGMTGLELLEQFPECPFDVIFITAHSEYAINAIKLSALDYLVKPVDEDELQKAVWKAENKIKREPVNPYRLMLNLLKENRNGPERQLHNIALPTFDRILYRPMESILYLQASQNYCTFYFKDNTALLISKNIGSFEDGLEEYDFMRVHRSYIVNLRKVEAYIRQDGGYLKLINGEEIEVSPKKREKLLKRLSEL